MSFWPGAESAVPHEETLLRVVNGIDADDARAACKLKPPTSCAGADRPRLFNEGFARSGATHEESTGPIGVEDGRDMVSRRER